ncbi:MAG: DUF6089 family protein [Bacteroidales bacterium]|nr:DUF6089 family protein [Bacteroidales bacterium]
MIKYISRISILLLALLCTTIQPSHAQRSEFGAFGGVSFYLGDLNPTTLFAQPKIAGGFLYRYNLSPRWALKADFVFSKISGSDALTNDNYARNLSFESPLTEFSVEAELNFFKLYNETRKNRFTPYIYAGITLFSFNPKAELNGTLYELQSLGTEGQGLEGGPGKQYSLTSVAIPFGIGIKVTMGRHFSLGAEWGMRYTFTDYLDDVGGIYFDNELLREQRGDIVADLADRSTPMHQAGEQRGNTTTTDLYSFAGLTFTVKFGNEDKTCDLKKPRKSLH